MKLPRIHSLLNRRLTMLATNEDTEEIQVVDRENRETGGMTRRLMRETGAIHRATYIFIWDKSVQAFYIQKRSMHKKYCPGYYDLSFGGVVGLGETYDDNAIREIKEEFGIESSQETGRVIRRAFEFYNENTIGGYMSKVHGMAYILHYSGDDYVKQDAEVEEIIKVTRQEIGGLAQDMITPDAL